MIRKVYPPARYVFYPLYRRLRRRGHLPMRLAYLLVWAVSGLLHGGVVLVFGDVVRAAIFAGIFVVLGLAGVIAITVKERRRRRGRGRRSR